MELDRMTNLILEGMGVTRLRILEEQCKKCEKLECFKCIFRDVLGDFGLASSRLIEFNEQRDELLDKLEV